MYHYPVRIDITFPLILFHLPYKKEMNHVLYYSNTLIINIIMCNNNNIVILTIIIIVLNLFMCIDTNGVCYTQLP